MKAIGFDIGTTTVCGIVMDTVSGDVLEVKTLSNDSALQGDSFERLQDPEKILFQVEGMYHEFLDRFHDICCIGLTGQMHGIVYTDENGLSVSPLYTWQDESGNEKMPDGRSYAECLSVETGYSMASGFGISTFYYGTKKEKLPEHAVRFCTIGDYVGMRMTGRKEPVITPSMGASLGCFDLQKLEFDRDKIEGAGMKEEFLPECRNGFVLLGKTPESIPVAAAIGDNQASVLGSVKSPKETVLINVGTGSQVSVGIDHYVEAKHVELRPLAEKEYILAGSGLCGGRAYAALEKFFSMTVEAMTGQKTDSLYEKMSDLMEKKRKLSKEPEMPLVANTRFCGTRENPSETGSFINLTLENFTPEAMTEAVLNGIAEELVTFHQRMLECGANSPTKLVGSGNGIRMNPWLRQIFEEIYHLPMQLPMHHEEAAFGATLYALCAAGEKENLDQARELIRYQETDACLDLEKKRKEALSRICDGDTLWDALLLFQGYTFYTMTGLEFTYEIRKGRNGEYTKELWIDRRGESKSLTMSTVLKAFQNQKGMGIVDRPKALGDLRGVSYIYPIFYHFGLIEVPEKIKAVLRGNRKEQEDF